jgi:hypothetical protein
MAAQWDQLTSKNAESLAQAFSDEDLRIAEKTAEAMYDALVDLVHEKYPSLEYAQRLAKLQEVRDNESRGLWDSFLRYGFSPPEVSNTDDVIIDARNQAMAKYAGEMYCAALKKGLPLFLSVGDAHAPGLMGLLNQGSGGILDDSLVTHWFTEDKPEKLDAKMQELLRLLNDAVGPVRSSEVRVMKHTQPL